MINDLDVKVTWSQYFKFYIGLCVVERVLMFDFEMRFV